MITRLFRLVVDPAQLDRFARVGEHNLTTSIDAEPGTLVMCACHTTDDPSVNYVFEAYRDEDAYDTHASSPQFAEYAALASEALTGREVIQTVPELLVEKAQGLRIVAGSGCSPRLAMVRTVAGRNEDFRDAVCANMRSSVEAEEGVLAMYAVTSADDPSQWYFMEVYASDDAYAEHRTTTHFKRYIDATADCVAEKELVPLVADTIVSQGGLRG